MYNTEGLGTWLGRRERAINININFGTEKTPEIMEQWSPSHSNDDVCCCSFSALVVDDGTHPLVGMVVTPECQVNFIFLGKKH